MRNNVQFEQLVINLEMQRNEPFYTLTLVLPILILAILAPTGLILPGTPQQQCNI